MPDTRVNIRPGVSILSVLRHLNYRPWFALAEFVDNALQSYLEHRERLIAIDGDQVRLKVEIEVSQLDEGRITIRDTAAGIQPEAYDRAFRAAAIPPDRSGLSEFGMGMKSAACWFAREWQVRTSALGEPVERTVRFDIADIVTNSVEDLVVDPRVVPASAHYTEIILIGLHKPPQGRTITKIKEHLASIYRVFLRDGTMELRFDGQLLTFNEPATLSAPYFKTPAASPVTWRKEIDFDFGLGMRASGFAALRETGSTSGAGFGLFRRGRLIEGSADEGRAIQRTGS